MEPIKYPLKSTKHTQTLSDSNKCNTVNRIEDPKTENKRRLIAKEQFRESGFVVDDCTKTVYSKRQGCTY